MTAKFTCPADGSWLGQAACRGEGIDPEWFFPTQDNGPSLSKARSVCAACFVKRDCLAYALEIEGGQPAKTREGVYAGTTGGERYRLYQRGRGRVRQQPSTGPKAAPVKRKAAECGTRSGYQKHVREKTEICPPCRQANTEADNRLRRTGSTKVSA